MGIISVLFLNTQRHIPDMYVRGDTPGLRQAYFAVKSQYLVNEVGIETKDSIYFSIDAFRGMVNYLLQLTNCEGIRVAFVGGIVTVEIIRNFKTERAVTQASSICLLTVTNKK